jgi:hypothetical protein
MLLSLNTDILCLISAWIPHDDLCAWRLSCKILAEAGDRFRFRVVKLRSARFIRELTAILTARPVYARHVEEVFGWTGWAGDMKSASTTVELGAIIEEVDEQDPDYMPATSLLEFLGGCEAFARLLQHTTTSVQRLQFPYAEAALSISSALGVAVTGCTHLTSLSLLELGYDLPGLDAAAIDMLRALRAPLRILNLDRLLGAETKTHLLDIIANFAETLEQLTVNMVYFGHYAGPGKRPTFVHLRTIALEHSVLDLPTFEAAFPLLEDLKVEDGEDEFELDDDPLAVQHAASNRDHRCATWTRLRFLSGDQNSLLGLGLSGHAPSVGLFNYGIVLDTEDDGRQLAIILTGMRVEMLTLSISPCIDGFAAAVGGMDEDTQILDLTVMTHMLSSNQLSIAQLMVRLCSTCRRLLKTERPAVPDPGTSRAAPPQPTLFAYLRRWRSRHPLARQCIPSIL